MEDIREVLTLTILFALEDVDDGVMVPTLRLDRDNELVHLSGPHVADHL